MNDEQVKQIAEGFTQLMRAVWNNPDLKTPSCESCINSNSCKQRSESHICKNWKTNKDM